MIIVYYSKTGNTKAFADRFKADGFEVLSISDAGNISKSFVIFTPTYNFGEVPAEVANYITKNKYHLKGVVSFGNLNWGTCFAQAGEKIVEKYGVPLIRKVEMRGTTKDYHEIRERLNGGIQ